MTSARGPSGERRGGTLVRQALGLVAVGTVLGVAFNVAGLYYSDPQYGLAWIPEPREVLDFETLSAEEPRPGPAPAETIPPIPAVGEPLMIGLDMVGRYHEAGAALIVDARDSGSFAEGHIPGAVNVPYGEATPDAVEALDPGDRPIIVYCGGDGCEISIDLAWDLIGYGHDRVAVYEGGFPEWRSAGRVVATGEEAVTAAAPATPTETFRTNIDDPMGFFGGEAAVSLPEIPVVDRPIKMQLASVKQFYDAGAAKMVDARDAGEYARAHIAGAINLPAETTPPETLARFDAAGKPIIVYCGGEPCDISMELAYALIDAGQRKVLIYAGGYREWEIFGYPVTRGGSAD
jgi:rhodanese-related sulfurtransferase